MTFTSLTFVLFVPVVFALHWTLRSPRTRNAVLVVASYTFYGWWDWRFCGLMLASSLVDFVAAQMNSRAEGRSARRAWLLVSLLVNLSLLGFFKYFGFFSESLSQALEAVNIEIGFVTTDIVLPVGISFYTFQTMSYTVDVHRRELEPSTNLVSYLAYVSFFPQLVAGPIERAGKMLRQFDADREFDAQRAYAGCLEILVGLFKKFAIADNLGRVVDIAYADPEAFSGVTLIVATVAFAFQIYCDFSGYSHMAIGCARLFAIDLSDNFRTPYFSTSMAEFWARWHISLSSWFRDYLYIPLGGNRVSKMRHRVNVMATFLLSGLWHGAAWNYVVWGGLNGAAVLVTNRKRTDRSRRNQFLPIALTFTLTCFFWVFFRASTLREAMTVLSRFPRGLFETESYREAVSLLAPGMRLAVVPPLLAVLVYAEWHYRERRFVGVDVLRSRSRTIALGSLFVWSSLWLVPSSPSSFVYFQF